MKTSQLYLSLMLITVLNINSLQGQNIENQPIVQGIYDALQDKNASSRDVAVLMPGIKWAEIKDPEGVNPRHTITLSALMKQQWRSIQFADLKFSHLDKNKLVVTGIVNGRLATECEYISSPFKHHWSLKDGKILSFAE